MLQRASRECDSRRTGSANAPSKRGHLVAPYVADIFHGLVRTLDVRTGADWFLAGQSPFQWTFGQLLQTAADSGRPLADPEGTRIPIGSYSCSVTNRLGTITGQAIAAECIAVLMRRAGMRTNVEHAEARLLAPRLVRSCTRRPASPLGLCSPVSSP